MLAPRNAVHGQITQQYNTENYLQSRYFFPVMLNVQFEAKPPSMTFSQNLWLPPEGAHEYVASLCTLS